MDDILKPIKTTRTNIGDFESLSINEGPQGTHDSTFSRRPGKDFNEIEEIPVEETHTGITELRIDQSKVSDRKSNEGTVGLELSIGDVGVADDISVAQRTFSSPHDVLDSLKAKPDPHTLTAALEYLRDTCSNVDGFNVKVSGPKAAQIVNQLVTEILPNYWEFFDLVQRASDGTQAKTNLLEVLRSVSGIGALTASLRASTAAFHEGTNNVATRATIECLAQVMATKQFVLQIMETILEFHGTDTQQRMLWQEFVSIVVGGKVLSTTGEAVFATKCLDPERDKDAWVADGRQYARWIGGNVTFILLHMSPADERQWSMVSQLVKRCTRMAHSDLFIAELLNSLILHDQTMWKSLQLLFARFSKPDQQLLFKFILNCSCNLYLQTTSHRVSTETSPNLRVSGVASLISGFTNISEHLKDYLVNWICSAGEGLGMDIDARRASIAAVAGNEDVLFAILEKSLTAFGDKLHIQHSPLMQQEALAQVILLATGYLHKLKSSTISSLSRSSVYIQMVSNRLASSLPRAQILGMIVGTAISRLIESPEKALKFDTEEMETSEAKWFMNLQYVNDEAGSLQALKLGVPLASRPLSKKRKIVVPGSQEIPATNISSRIISIEELSDAESDDGLVPYQKPDEDPQDSDDDPTLTNRVRPVARVYIKDLVADLRSNDKPEVVELALKTAPGLIRRKANFGTELSESIDRLAAALLNVQEGMSKRENQDSRLQSMIACIVAHPARMAPWFINMYFEGDLSQAQRASVTTAVGLSARELGGFDDASLEGALPRSQNTFASKRLPPKLEAIYSPQTSHLSTVARQIEHSTLQPMALAAADKLTGPDILKVRTFSSRMEVERKGKEKAQERKRRIPKDLHKLLSESFYLELCGRLDIVISGSRHQSSTLMTSLLDPPLLRLVLQTHTIILSTLGPHAPQLPLLTRETLLMLTSLHNISTLALDPAVLPALLNLLLLILDLNIAAGVNSEERLITEFGTQVAELVSWAAALIDRGTVAGPSTSSEGDDGDMPWTVVAAGIQVKWMEVGRKFQGRMLGLGPQDF